MSDGDIDYSGYTLRQLEEALSGINRQKYPQNCANLHAAYTALAASSPPEPGPPEVQSTQETEVAWAGPEYDASGRYVPNQVPARRRVARVCFSMLLLAYASYGIWINDLYVPGKRRGVHLHDVPAWIMYGAAVCACVVMLAMVLDHYDRRDNERHYRVFAKVGSAIGWTCFGISLVLGVFGQRQSLK